MFSLLQVYLNIQRKGVMKIALVVLLIKFRLDSKMSVWFQRTLYSDIINTLFDSTLAFQSTFSLITRKIVGKIDDNLPFDFDMFCFALSKQMRHAIQLQAIQALNKGLNIEHTVSLLDICKTNTLFEAYTVIRITLLA